MESQKIHHQLRELAKTLNCFCIVEILILCFMCFMTYDLLTWYKGITTVASFNPIAFWGAIAGVVTSIMATTKHLNDSFKEK